MQNFIKMRSRSPKSYNFFPMSQWCFRVSLVEIHHLVQERRHGSLYSLYSVVTLTIRSRSSKSNHFFLIIPMIQYIKFARIHHLVQEIGCRQAFWSKFDIQSAGVTLKLRSVSPKSTGNHFFSMSQWCFCVSLVKIQE